MGKPHFQTYEAQMKDMSFYEKYTPFLSQSKGEKMKTGHKLVRKFGTYKVLFIVLTLIGLIAFSSWNIDKGEPKSIYAPVITGAIFLLIFMTLGSMFHLFFLNM